MAICNKYSVEERHIASRIYDLMERQKELRTKWLDIDIKINLLKHKLDGKYGHKKFKNKKRNS